jgi:hypothetical protein
VHLLVAGFVGYKPPTDPAFATNDPPQDDMAALMSFFPSTAPMPKILTPEEYAKQKSNANQ